MNIQAKARVLITLEINLSDTWSSTCDIEQVYKQAKQSAMTEIESLLDPTKTKNIRLFKEPHVIEVLTEKKV